MYTDPDYEPRLLSDKEIGELVNIIDACLVQADCPLTDFGELHHWMRQNFKSAYCDGRTMLLVAQITAATELGQLDLKKNSALLEDKHKEWDDALHSYETNGFASKSQGSEYRAALVKLDNIKNNDLRDRYAKSINDDFGDDIPLAKQQKLEF